jgi:hypothetical protein
MLVIQRQNSRSEQYQGDSVSCYLVNSGNLIVTHANRPSQCPVPPLVNSVSTTCSGAPPKEVYDRRSPRMRDPRYPSGIFTHGQAVRSNEKNARAKHHTTSPTYGHEKQERSLTNTNKKSGKTKQKGNNTHKSSIYIYIFI